MLKIKFKEGDQYSPIYARMRESALQAIQEELCSVIEEVGIELDPKNHHQISEALTLIDKIQDRPQTFIFEPKDRVENPDRALTFYSDFTLDSSQHQAVSFKLSVSEKQGDEFTLQYESIFRLSFQQKSARWVFHTMGGGMSVNQYAYSASPTELNCRRATHHPASFFMDVTLDERLAITSPTMAFLKPTRITFSQFQFVRRIFV